MQAVSLNVDDEVKALGDALAIIVADVKAGKSLIQDFTDAFGALLGAIGSIQNLPVDIKKVDNQAYLIFALAKVLEPAPAA